MIQRHQERAGKPLLRIWGFAIVQTTGDDIYAKQSQLWDRQSGVGVETEEGLGSSVSK